MQQDCCLNPDGVSGIFTKKVTSEWHFLPFPSALQVEALAFAPCHLGLRATDHRAQVPKPASLLPACFQKREQQRRPHAHQLPSPRQLSSSLRVLTHMSICPQHSHTHAMSPLNLFSTRESQTVPFAQSIPSQCSPKFPFNLCFLLPLP